MEGPYNTRSKRRRRIENEETEAASSEAASSEAASSGAASSEAASSGAASSEAVSSAAASSAAASSEEDFQPFVSQFKLSTPPYTDQYPNLIKNLRYKEFLKTYTGFNIDENLDNLSSEQGLLMAWAHIQDIVITFIKDWVNKKLKFSEESDNPETRDVNDINKFFIKKTYKLLKEKINDDFLYDYFKFDDLRREFVDIIGYIERKGILPILDIKNLKAYFPVMNSDDYNKLYLPFLKFIYAFECIKLPTIVEHDFEVPKDIDPHELMRLGEGEAVVLNLLPIDVALTENPLRNVFFPVNIKKEEAVPGKIITRSFEFPIDRFQGPLVHRSNIPNTPEHRQHFKEYHKKLNKKYGLNKLNVIQKELLFLRLNAKETGTRYREYIAYTFVIIFLENELKKCDEERKRKEYYNELIEKMRLEHERKTSTLRASKKSKKKKRPKKSKKKKKPKKSKKKKKPKKSKKSK